MDIQCNPMNMNNSTLYSVAKRDKIITREAMTKNFHKNWNQHPIGDICGFSGVAHRLACWQLTIDQDKETRDNNTDAH